MSFAKNISSTSKICGARLPLNFGFAQKIIHRNIVNFAQQHKSLKIGLPCAVLVADIGLLLDV